ncbi:MAG TPA: L-serine ammonia-lyase, iron-sulfur-dependent, subunit alpha [Bacilli bacterium]|nr:L-serine ammonia-lyase, iron-sulfur-dependent, subunit alpha [Bacilli bacterium]
MDTIRNLYTIGSGPSSSHTMGPKKAAETFLKRNSNAHHFQVELYGSLASTGKGHLTDYIVAKTLGNERTNVLFLPEKTYQYHTNGLKFFAYNESSDLIDEWLVFSVGGGSLKELNESRRGDLNTYPHKTMEEILHYCEEKHISLYEYVVECEGKDIIEFGKQIIKQMFLTIEKGLKEEADLPGDLHLQRRAKTFYNQYLESNNMNALIYAAALATSEENASGGTVVTAPTCGSSGVVPSVLYKFYKINETPMSKLVEGLLVGGLIGNLVKHNASISGAEVGCQGEVGTACSMAAAMAAHIKGGSLHQIEYAAEIGLEHHLGMTCDPILGYVQIPCIERNAMSSRRAIDSAEYALLTDGQHYMMLDSVIDALNETGKDLNEKYRETALGGLALKKVKQKKRG